MSIWELAIVGLLVVLGALTCRDMIALRRWEPAFLRRGIVLLRRTRPLGHRPEVLPNPQIPASWSGWRSQVRRLGPHEIALTAPAGWNAPLMRGLLHFDERASAVVVTGRLVWGPLPLIVLGMGGTVLWMAPREGASLAAFLLVSAAAFGGGSYVSERGRLIRALDSVALELRDARS